VGKADNLTTFMFLLSWNMRASASWNPQGLSKPVQVTNSSLLRISYYKICRWLKF